MKRNIENTSKNHRVISIYEWVEAIIAALIIVTLFFSAFFRVAEVDGTSMIPNLYSGDRVFLTGIYTKPVNGDVVVIAPNGSEEVPLIKRVIATENQTVDIDRTSGKVSVDGVELDETRYIGNNRTDQESDLQFPLTVPSGHVFVLGDNRSVSKDSRSADIGFIDQKDIIGKALLVIFPFDRMGGIVS
ncbi:signal peptidase I [Caproicibacterium sp. NSD3]